MKHFVLILIILTLSLSAGANGASEVQFISTKEFVRMELWFIGLKGIGEESSHEKKLKAKETLEPELEIALLKANLN